MDLSAHLAVVFSILYLLFVLAFRHSASLSLSSDVLDCPPMDAPTNGNMVEIRVPSHILQYTCHPGFHLVGPVKLECINGSWTPPEITLCERDVNTQSKCVTAPPAVLNGRTEYNRGDTSFPKEQGSMATVVCDPGYSSADTFQTSYVIVCGPRGLWTLTDGTLQLPACTRKHCPTPPEVPRALYHYNTYNPMMSEGLKVEYICDHGYELLDPANATLMCRNGQWEGPVPTCVLKVFCKTPSSVRNGKWQPIVKNKADIFSGMQKAKHGDLTRFEVGSEIEYTCDPRYKLIGHSVLQCEPSRGWSSVPPECIPASENTWYCSAIDQIKNGFCKCEGENTADLQLCMPFHRGTQIECTCLQGYKLQGVNVLTCIQSDRPNIGAWDWPMPRCFKDFDPEGGMETIPDGKDNANSYNSGDISDDKNKVPSLVIVVTTACSVLGVLLLIMVVVFFRRKKSRTNLFQQRGPVPPPYARVHNSLDEHDRLALMAYADASRVHLPTYEEAIRPGAGGQPGVVTAGAGMVRTSSPTSSEYRRLPSIHPAVRAANQMQHQQNVGGDGNNNINNNNNNNNSNRHSTVTTSTMNRDGVSEIFGSLDTVNVSMSDASTSVTVETFDSGTSNRSIASQRATAGSLNSSDDQLANDDAPLLDSTSQREADVMSVSSNPSRTSKEDQ